MSGGTDPFHVCPCFLPVDPNFVAAFAALKVSFPGVCPGKDVFYFDEETTGKACSLLALLFQGGGDDVSIASQ
ncbi:MAG: hypothetical protein PT943_04715 [Ruminococcus sp.]|nr:hypothetical protein [Ruminococcus sp.]